MTDLRETIARIPRVTQAFEQDHQLVADATLQPTFEPHVAVDRQLDVRGEAFAADALRPCSQGIDVIHDGKDDHACILRTRVGVVKLKT